MVSRTYVAVLRWYDNCITPSHERNDEGDEHDDPNDDEDEASRDAGADDRPTRPPGAQPAHRSPGAGRGAVVRVRPHTDDQGVVAGYVFHCPGCEHGHIFYTSGNVTWKFNGNVDNPTFSPSLLNTCESHPNPKWRRCHLFLTDGKLRFCADCSHDYAGKTYELPDMPQR